MRTLTEQITSSINEARELEYRVSLNGFKDKDGIPITITCLILAQYKKEFEQYLEDEQDNSVLHAEDKYGDFEI